MGRRRETVKEQLQGAEEEVKFEVNMAVWLRHWHGCEAKALPPMTKFDILSFQLG